MSQKRRNTSSLEPEDSSSPKRRKSSSEYESDTSGDSDIEPEDATTDHVYGQTGAFPGLGKQSDELFYGPAADDLH